MMFRIFSKIWAIIIISTLLSSCGFSALHSKVPQNKITLPSIEIVEIKSINGAALYETLSHLIDSSPDAKYRIEISLKYNSSDLLISKKSDVTETKVLLYAYYKLIDNSTNNLILSDKVSVDSYYNSLYPSYSTHVSSRKLEEDLAKLSAEYIYRKLVAYFITIVK